MLKKPCSRDKKNFKRQKNLRSLEGNGGEGMSEKLFFII
jgi:hypothetical protein